MKDKKLYMIGNAHLDPVWLWNWQEGFQEVKATFRSALDRMKEDKDFVFTCSSAAFYEWVEKNNPAMFAEIRKEWRKGAGSWQAAGGYSRTATSRPGKPLCARGCMDSVIFWRSSEKWR